MTYRAGWIHFTNVAPILDSLDLPPGVSAITGVPTQMNAALLAGEVDIANISAVEFIRHADILEALPDFSVSVLGPVYSVNLFHTRPLAELRRLHAVAQARYVHLRRFLPGRDHPGVFDRAVIDAAIAASQTVRPHRIVPAPMPTPSQSTHRPPVECGRGDPREVRCAGPHLRRRAAAAGGVGPRPERHRHDHAPDP